MRGIFISFEGGEGAGKSTQANILAGHLRADGREVLTLRDPGGTPVGEKIREVLLDRENTSMVDKVELLLFLASRSQLVHEVIIPALDRGAVVITDRFHHSTLAYQCGARGLDLDEVSAMNEFATSGVLPEVTFLLDQPTAAGFARKHSGKADRMENQGDKFHQMVREFFLFLAEKEKENIVVIDAGRGVDEIAAEIYAAVKSKLLS